MIQGLILTAGFFSTALAISVLVRKRLLQIQFAFFWLTTGLVLLGGSLVVPRSDFINQKLGVSPTGALLGLFAFTVICLILAMGVSQARSRELLRILVSELAISKAESLGMRDLKIGTEDSDHDCP